MTLYQEGTLLVGLGHKARQGKDKLAYRLASFYYPEGRVYGFADALKAYCRVAHGMTKKDPTLLQRVGAEFRQHQPDKWIVCLEHRLREEKPAIAFISDLRYKNEHEWVRRHGGIVIDVKRMRADGTQFIAQDRDPNHSSEIDLDDAQWDYVLEAPDGNLRDLYHVAYREGIVERLNWIVSPERRQHTLAGGL